MDDNDYQFNEQRIITEHTPSKLLPFDVLFSARIGKTSALSTATFPSVTGAVIVYVTTNVLRHSISAEREVDYSEPTKKHAKVASSVLSRGTLGVRLILSH